MKFTFAPESRPLDGYTIKRAIHRGGFGEVYYALTNSGREVALKLLQHNTDVELRGVQQCLNLSHPNLVTIFDVRQDDDEDHWIIMEYVAGDTLEAVIRKHPGGMPMELVRHWVHGIVAGMHYLHSRGIVHRDLKPGNIFSQGESIKIGDIGLSKFITHSRRSAQTQSVGTVYYMAPEVAKGRYGKEVDIYGLGVMIYEMITGELPFDGESTGEILMKHLTERPDLTRLPSNLRSVIAKALEKDPAARYQNMQDFGKAFDDAVLGRGSAVVESPPLPFRIATQPAKPRDYPSWVKEGHTRVDRQPALVAERPERQLGWQLSPTGNTVVWGPGIAAAFFTWALGGLEWAVMASFLLSGFVYMWLWILRAAPWREVQELAAPAFLPLPGQKVAASTTTIPPRERARRQLIGQYLGGAALVVPVVSVLTGGMYLFAPTSFEAMLQISGPAGRGLEVQAFVVISAVLASWVILGIPVVARLITGKETSRRWPYACAGLVLGLLTWGLNDYLMVNHKPPGGVFEEIGDHRLFTVQGTPTPLGFVAFFVPFLAFRSWFLQTQPTRNRRLSLMTVFGTIVLAWLVSHVFAFPHFLAATWAAVISLSVQICSPWYERVPPRPERR